VILNEGWLLLMAESLYKDNDQVLLQDLGWFNV
jgi:hypothetical protein